MSPWSIRNSPSNTQSPRRVQLRVQSLEGRNMPASGGYTASGILGQYFDNPDLTGEPAFVRRDVRVDFDWQDRAPGGSHSAGYERVGADNFSVRWTGQVIPQFSEMYTLRVNGDDGARLWIKPASEAIEWTLLVDAWETPTAEPVTADYPMISGTKYDVRFEYRELEGTATARLAWSSPRTAQTVIEPVVNLGVNAVTYDYHLYADAAKMGRPKWGDPANYFGGPQVATDMFGWPLGDAGHLFWSNRDATKTGGTYLLEFVGQAEVAAWSGRGRFHVDDVEYGSTLPLGVGYNAETNTTTAEVDIDSTEFFGMYFTNTRRLPEDIENTGVTNVKLMRPRVVDGTTHYLSDELFDADVKQAFSRFTTLRYLTANFNPEKEWADRKLPDAMQAAWGDRAAVWEHEVMLANEIGKDLYITLPVGATADYLRNLALLIRYGSDGVMPYSEATADPVYAGLNPNLRVYVEWGNEIWNWAFSQGGWAADAGRAAVLNQTPEGQIINYDGLRPNGDFRRWAALRTVEASTIFREIWGDSSMGDRVRVVLEFQYDNQQSTALGPLQFIDSYFNNGDGNENVLEPRPVSYYIWGAGGAAYFGASNPRGLVSDIVVPGGTFENITIGPGGTFTPTPASTTWMFQGDAGLYRNVAGIAPNVPMSVVGMGKLPSAPTGKQAMYISGTGSATVTITFKRAGVFAIDFQAAAKLSPGVGNQLDFYLGDTKITPNGHELNPPPHPWWPGNGSRNANTFSAYGTVPVQITQPGKYTFRIAGRGPADRTTVIDDVRIASLDAIYKSRIPTGVKAAGQVTQTLYQTQLALEASYAQAYGLKVVAYEGGWSLGGDGASVPLQSWAKYRDPRTAPIMSQAIDTFHRAGGDVYIMGTYDQWYYDDAANADSYPIVQGIDARLGVLTPLQNGGSIIRSTAPVTLTAAKGLKGHIAPVNAAPGEWVSWTVNLTTTADYRITAKADPDGWAAVFVDGIELGRGSSGMLPGGVVRLAAGVHTIRVQSTGGWYGIRGIVIDRLDAPLTA